MSPELIVVAVIAFVLGLSIGRTSARESERAVLARVIKRRVDRRVSELYRKTGADVEGEIALMVARMIPAEEPDPRD